ncbi:MAG TPA: DUF2520 domain-containing protein [Acidimicrobiales bacterium]|nr:DUF2520 domain-containing protein [Acidimicrobiales bacterium]
MTARQANAPQVPRVRIVGTGRVAGALGTVLEELDWDVLAPIGRRDDCSGAAHQTDVVVIATPDRAIAEVAAAIEPDAGALVVHVAGSVGLEVLAGHPRRGALHPLVSIPDPVTGAIRLRDGAWFAVAADHDADLALLGSIVAALHGHSAAVADADRAAYHAAAVVASNHLVALMGQVERIAATTGVPVEAFAKLASQTLDGLATATPTDALTGPVRRGDWATVARHLDALAPAERPGYAALAELAAGLVPGDAEAPAWLAVARRGDDSATRPGERDLR